MPPLVTGSVVGALSSRCRRIEELNGVGCGGLLRLRTLIREVADAREGQAIDCFGRLAWLAVIL